MEQNKGTTRRRFFASLGLLAATGAAIKASHSISTAKATAPPPDDSAGEGYRLTEHIKKYYRTTII